MMEKAENLISFTFKNFKSYYDETTFSMQASDDIKFNELNTIETIDGDLLKCAVVFGANGSGKSNFIRAIEFMKNIVLADLSLQSSLIKTIDNFAFYDFSSSALFEIEFISDDIMYNYGFELLNGEIDKEYLSTITDGEKTDIFIRNSPKNDDIILDNSMDNVKNFIKNTRPDTLFLYWANFGYNEIAMTVYSWFESLQIFDAASLGEQLFDDTINYINQGQNNKKNVLDFLVKTDINISGIEIKSHVKTITLS